MATDQRWEAQAKGLLKANQAAEYDLREFGEPTIRTGGKGGGAQPTQQGCAREIHSGVLPPMPFSDWYSNHPAIGRLIALAVALAGLSCAPTVYVAVPCCVEFAGDAPHQNQEANRGAEQSARCSDAVAWPVVSDKDQAKATTSNNEDKAPSKIECEDLKAQRRMAVAAERSLQLGCYQFWLGILGALLLLGTVIYTAISANAAADAARAALNSERAFVKMSHEPPGLTLDPVAGTATVSVQVQNSGRTPADVIGVNLSARVLATGEKLPKVPEYSPTPACDVAKHSWSRMTKFSSRSSIA